MKVGLPNNIFAKSLADYSDWKTAWIREAVQNSVDAGATEIEFNIYTNDPEQAADWGVITCRDNGCGMDEKVLHDVFLCLGESYKVGDSMGGFGRAKEILLFAHPEWDILTKTKKSGTLGVRGGYIEYDNFDDGFLPMDTGTQLRVEVNDASDWLYRAKEYLRYCQLLGCKITVNGETINGMRKGTVKQDLGWAKVYTNGSDDYSSRLFVRKNGVVMFEELYGVETTLILEIEDDSTVALTTNRDGLKQEYKSQLRDLVAMEYKTKYENPDRKDEGLSLAFSGFGIVASSNILAGAVGDGELVPSDKATPPCDYGIPFVFRFSEEKDEFFSWQDNKVRKIGSAWVQIVEMMARDFVKDMKEVLNVVPGFTLANDAVAELLTTGGYEIVLVNPRYYLSKSIEAIAYRLVEDAVHEFAHITEKGHNNNFVARMNGIKEKIFRNGGAKRYYGIVSNFIENKIDLIGDEPEMISEEKELLLGENDFFKKIDALVSYDNVETKKRISYKDFGGRRNVLTVRKDLGMVSFNMANFEEMSCNYKVIKCGKKSCPALKYKEATESEKEEILNVIQEYMTSLS